MSPSSIEVNRSAFPCSAGCFRPAGNGDGDAVENGDGGVDRRRPTHLLVTVNGIIGSADNWRFAAKQFVKRYPEDVIVHCSECNRGTSTFHGVDVMGQRLAKEILSVVADKPELQKISFLSHSLGGLVARYAIALLYEAYVPVESSDEKEQCTNPKNWIEPLEHKSKGKIAGLEPINFITFATPHLGSRSHKQIPLLRGSYALEKMAYRIAWIAGRTGKHLFLKDNSEGKPPLLLQMVNDVGDLRFMSALRSFRRRVAYSNVCFDFIVGWKTSSIRYQHELPKREKFIRNEKYPHVVYVEKPKHDSVSHEGLLETTDYQPKTFTEMEDVMTKCLNGVSWERVDVSFSRSKQRIFAHSTIQADTLLAGLEKSCDPHYGAIDTEPGPLIQLGCGTISGALGATCVYPLQVIRTRMQAQSTSSSGVYKGMSDVFWRTLKHEGLSGFYKGIFPNMLKVVPSASITYLVYEAMKKRLSLD